ncbi:hypothetical protein MKW92_028169 [Papaver armeniacum]|nr:hypothetical protein MKW92_028169 [Papaver armeniacum]
MALLLSPLHHHVSLNFAFSSSLQFKKCREFRRSIIKAPLTGKTLEFDDFESHHALLEKGLAYVAISSKSVVTHQPDSPEFMAKEAKLFKYSFPYLYEKSQGVVRAFGAVFCTPDFLLYKKDGRKPFELVYCEHRNNDDVTCPQTIFALHTNSLRSMKYV